MNDDMTLAELLRELTDNGINAEIDDGELRLSGGDDLMRAVYCELLEEIPYLRTALIEVLRGNGVKKHLQEASRMTAGEYARECENAGIVLKIDAWTYDIDMAGGNEKTRLRLRSILDKSPTLKASVILSKAVKDPALMDMIQERACVRWSEGYSDSLNMAVMSSLTSTGEEALRDDDGEIILKPKTDWEQELSRQ